MTILDLPEILCFRSLENFDRIQNLVYVDSNEFSYCEFFKNFMSLNKPCVLKGVTDGWPCQNLWTVNDEPNITFFKEKYGNAVIPVANCNEKYYNSQSKTDMIMSEYVDYWLNYSVAPSGSMPCLYLKDWHFQRDFPEDKVYQLPVFFASDWLNEYLLREPNFVDDYRFVYIGPKGSWTPFHSDVFSSFSWSVNICGKKKWVFYAPGEEKHLADKFGNLTYSVESDELEDRVLFPHQDGLTSPLVLIQEVGDAVFVPSGWHHQVWNLEDTISINHNWVNGCNIGLVWEDILARLREVEVEIGDCRDMEDWTERCQLLLSSVHGMDLRQFHGFLSYTAETRLDALDQDMPLSTNLSHYRFGRNHIKYDLLSLRSVLVKMLKEDLECLLPFNNKLTKLIELISVYIE